jgi:predicted nuclease of predicted toxin-antitoxin system
VKLADRKFLADENIHGEVVRALRETGTDIISVGELGWFGKTDAVVLDLAMEQQRVVLTHDSDFGNLAVVQGQPHAGIIFLRPGHIKPLFTLQSLRRLLELPLDLPRQFLLVAQRVGDQLKVRVRPDRTDEPAT